MTGFTQVDVFGSDGGLGNPVAVVHDAVDWTSAQMQRFANWTNLSETTFLLPPTDPRADYRLRIFTPAEELPFAGHPTLGSAHAWREAGGSARESVMVQECAAGLVQVRGEERLAFAAPPLIRSGAPTEGERATALGALGVHPDQVVDLAWVDNGPGWLGVLLADAEAVLALRPDWSAFGGIEIGVIGAHSPADRSRLGADVEVRAFCPSLGIVEDPVTGSLNAGLAQWLIAAEVLPASYVAAQGTCVGRRGRVQVTADGTDVWVGGATTTVIAGSVTPI